MTHRSLALLASLLAASASYGQAAKPAPKPTTQPAAPIKTLKQMLTPTLISLQCKAATSEGAVALLEKQVGFSLEAREPESRADDQGKITSNQINQPYWAVIRDVCVQGDLRVSTMQAKRAAPFALALRREATRDFMYFPAKVDSALVPTLTDITYRRDRQTGQEDKSRLYLRVAMLAEPKVFIAGYKRQSTVELAVDDQGGSLLLPPPETGSGNPNPGQGNNPGGGVWGWPRGGGGMGGRGGGRRRGLTDGAPQVFLAPGDDRSPAQDYQAVPRHNEFPQFWPSIKPPVAPAKMIKRLKGTATLVFGFDPVLQDVSGLLTGGEEKIAIGRNGAITLSAYGPAPVDQKSVLFNVTLPRVKLANGNWTDETLEFRSMRFIMTDAQGNSFGYTGLHDQNVSGDQVTYTAKFAWPWNDDGQFESKPVKVTAILPTRLEEATIPFDFADIPMPVAEPPQPPAGATPPAAK